MEKFEIQKNNFINKFFFKEFENLSVEKKTPPTALGFQSIFRLPVDFSYRFLQNFKKLCDINKLQIIFSIKRFPTT